MGLLTKEERRTLDRGERRALRRKRRAERKAERKARKAEVGGVRIDLDTLRREAATMMLDLADDDISGPEKMDEVLDELVEMADDLLVWTWAGPAAPFLELGDGPALRAMARLVLRPYVQRLYDELREIGLFHG